MMNKRTGFKEWILRSILILFGTLTGLVMAECTARIVGIRPVVLDEDMFQPNSDPLLPYKLRPGYRAYFAGGKVTIEQNGQRHVVTTDQPQRPRSDGAGKRKIILVGDSIVFGHGLDDKDTIASQLASLFRSERVLGEVRTIAVPGYTSWNEYAALAGSTELYNAGVVLLVYVDNDITFDNDKMKMSDGHIAIVGHSLFHSMTRWLYSNIYISNVLLGELKKWTNVLGYNPNLPIDYSALTYSMKAIEGIKNLFDQNDVVLLVAIYRQVGDVSNQQLEYEKKIMDALNAR